MNYLKRKIVFLFLLLARVARGFLMVNEDAYKLLFYPGFESVRWRIGKWKAWLAYEKARKTTPAYKEFLRKLSGDIVVKGLDPDFSHIRPMDKESYIKRFSIESRCAGGRLPGAGVIIDESSGTSGEPNNWVRGYEERSVLKRVLQISMRHMLGKEQIFLINAFALGPWATGLNVSMSLVDVTILKSTGPDISKIENTLNFFGPEYRYVITGYPPFLKILADSKKVDWSQFDITIIFGGEGMSEEMRSYLEKSFKKVYGSYGASDLEINIAAENDFTIALRRLMLKNEDLFKKLCLSEHGVTPMVFQYNPLDYYIETNKEGELLVTLCRLSNIAPKIRYNIHDLGHVWRVPQLKNILRDCGIDIKDLASDYSDLPVLFHYGRSDMSVAFYGSKITPQDIEEVIFSLPELAKAINSFSLLVSEDESINKKLTVAIELRVGVEVSDFDQVNLQKKVLDRLATVNQDYCESIKMIPKGLEPSLKLYKITEGPFSINDNRLKKHYIQKNNFFG